MFICLKPKRYILERTRFFWFLVICFGIPFLSELLVQLIRGPFQVSDLDGASRSLLALLIFTCLSRVRLSNLSSALGLGALLGIGSVTVWVNFS